jgi:hypothetical protein
MTEACPGWFRTILGASRAKFLHFLPELPDDRKDQQPLPVGGACRCFPTSRSMDEQRMPWPTVWVISRTTCGAAGDWVEAGGDPHEVGAYRHCVMGEGLGGGGGGVDGDAVIVPEQLEIVGAGDADHARWLSAISSRVPSPADRQREQDESGGPIVSKYCKTKHVEEADGCQR